MSRVMKAMVLTGHGGLDKYAWHEDWPMPEPGPMQALIKVGACGLNNTDVNTRTGWYSKTVTEATTGAAHDEVGGSDPTWGGRPIVFPRIQGADAVVDSELTDAELATFSCSYTTAEGILNRAIAGANDTVLVPGASGGVGGALIQLAKRRGARVIAMAAEAKHADVARLGPDRILPRAPENLREALEGERVTVVADIVGGPLWPALIDILARGGRYTCSGAIAGPIVTLYLRTFYLRDLTFTGSTVVPSHVFKDVVGYIERGEIEPVLAATYPLRDLCAAQQAFIDKRHAGNIVVVP